MTERRRIGLALSGGGSRAIAFHLGCLRALQDRGVLGKVSVLSTVSGGSVIGALWAYNDASFDLFQVRVEALLRQGLIWGIVRQTLLSAETPRIAAAMLVAGVPAAAGALGRLGIRGAGLLGLRGRLLDAVAEAMTAPVPRFASRTTAFERHLRRSVYGDMTMDQVARNDLMVVVNATELRTGTAFRFGSEESGCWRYGRLVAIPSVARAVAASAAFPALLPALDLVLEFEQENERRSRRVIVSDGGVYDNLGISCLLPGRSAEFSTNTRPVDFIIACVAGAGLPSGSTRPYSWAPRMQATVNTIHRRTHSQYFDLLHRMKVSGEIGGFLLPYLGQIDGYLLSAPADLVPREAVKDYPTDFNPMSATNIRLLSDRGEQLTRLLLEAYAPDM